LVKDQEGPIGASLAFKHEKVVEVLRVPAAMRLVPAEVGELTTAVANHLSEIHEPSLGESASRSLGDASYVSDVQRSAPAMGDGYVCKNSIGLGKVLGGGLGDVLRCRHAVTY
jgi:hypothetical protein